MIGWTAENEKIYGSGVYQVFGFFQGQNEEFAQEKEAMKEELDYDALNWESKTRAILNISCQDLHGTATNTVL